MLEVFSYFLVENCYVLFVMIKEKKFEHILFLFSSKQMIYRLPSFRHKVARERTEMFERN